MMKPNLLINATLITVVMAGSAHGQQPADHTTPASKTKRIVLVGDSTMNHTTGWGSGFCDDLTGDVECLNMARNGRSSKSYRADGFWTRALALKPAYLLISFGGNDMLGKGVERETDPKTDFYANMKAYVIDAKAIGAEPILVTPMELRIYDKDGSLMPILGDYAVAIRKVAADTNTALVDLYALSTEYLQTQTQATADELDYGNPVAPTILDRAHLNRKGSELMGRFVAEALKTVEPKLAKSVKLP